MKLSRRRSGRWSALAGVLVLAFGSLAALAGGDSPLELRGITVQDRVVRVTVTNVGDETATGTVVVRAVVEGREMGVAHPVTVSGGQKVFVQVEMSSPIQEVVEVGVVLDDGSPF